MDFSTRSRCKSIARHAAVGSAAQKAATTASCSWRTPPPAPSPRHSPPPASRSRRRARSRNCDTLTRVTSNCAATSASSSRSCNTSCRRLRSPTSTAGSRPPRKRAPSSASARPQGRRARRFFFQGPPGSTPLSCRSGSSTLSLPSRLRRPDLRTPACPAGRRALDTSRKFALPVCRRR